MARTIELGEEGVRIRYGGADALATLVRDLHVPYVQIASVEVGLEDAPSPWAPRRVGVAEPLTGRRRGRFWSGGRRLFLDLRDPSRALVLNCRPGARWDVIAIETDAAESQADLIRRRLIGA